MNEAEAIALATASTSAAPWRVASVQKTPAKRRPAPPFITSTLQQEANRKLRYSSKRTMDIAQQLYEGIDLKGERVGLITYMRTDSVSLAERAVEQARTVITDAYGESYLPSKPVHYKTKAKRAQEAHEAIRPTDLSRKPKDVARFPRQGSAAALRADLEADDRLPDGTGGDRRTPRSRSPSRSTRAR